jgi:hypothetical protein
MSKVDTVFDILTKDKEFLTQWESAGAGTIDTWFVSKDTKFAYGFAYLGYLIGKHGHSKARSIYDSF